MPITATLERVLHRLEHASALDKPSELGAGVLERVLPKGRLGDLASGTPIGHPLHPVLVAIPIGSWTAATYLDLTGGGDTAARRLVGLGNLAALPAALTGANDWMTTSGAERRVGFAHAVLYYAALGLYSASWLARRRGKHVGGATLSLAGAAVLSGAGWLGGHLAYGLGVGVDTTAFQQAPEDWTDVAAQSAVPAGQAIARDAGGVPVLLARHEGRILALADRCAHRGGPLHEGAIADGCVTCPWHDSTFALVDGAVISGPATRPQPTLEVRIVDGRVQVRRPAEARALRANPVGH